MYEAVAGRALAEVAMCADASLDCSRASVNETDCPELRSVRHVLQTVQGPYRNSNPPVLQLHGRLFHSESEIGTGCVVLCKYSVLMLGSNEGEGNASCESYWIHSSHVA